MSDNRNNTNTIWITMLAVLILLGGFPMKAAHAQSPQKATWLWNTRLIASSATDILQFAASEQINLIYLQINRDLDADVYYRFIAAASAQGIAVQALDGDPSWALDSRRSQLQASLDWIASYQRSAAAAERFSGIHIDIEPYLLREWRTNQKKVIRGWQQSVLNVVQTARQLGIPASADIPFWLHTLPTTDKQTTLSSWMMQQYDGITIMAYRDRADAIVDVASTELSEAVTAGIPVYVAVETNPSAEGNGITFYEEGAAYMNTQLQLVTGMAAAYSSFAGLAIHDYAGWSALHDR
ncbi:hypothetical protein [Paenibacillus campi]|uniref:hypothetical protein n=1 Tax=Paenibacillus campi TaxID=3106031 RepID=UPI002AFECFBA|nr:MULTISPECIES: hypothetical protein [unclassified Paenibacillus]